MKVALVHDYIKEYGGAERVLEALHELYPDATVFTSVYLPEYLGPHRERFANWNITTSWFQHVPFNAKLISPFRLLSPWVFKGFDFSDYDVVIVSATGAYFPNALRRKGHRAQSKENATPSPLRTKSVHICYCHTPPRYLYGYATARDWKKNKLVASLTHIANHFLRIVDFNASKNVDHYIANSEEVAGRIKKFYRRDATVIYPPVDIAKSKEQRAKSEESAKYKIPNTTYYLAGGRLARAKHIDLIIHACQELGVPLKIFGKSFAGYGEELELLVKDTKILGDKDIKKKEGLKAPNIAISQYPNIQLLGEVTDEEKWDLLKNAKAYIFAGEDEDFGILPVEAMSAGTPVIAYKSGGVKETVIDGKTGLFFDELTVDSLVAVIKKFEKTKLVAKDCQKQAEKFSKERFQTEIKNLINAKYKRSV